MQIPQQNVGQRIDNFLIRHFKGVPKSRIYRAVRGGEVRVNKKRIKADYRLQAGDVLRLPPLRQGKTTTPPRPKASTLQLIEQAVIFENRGLLIINKPSGIAVHGGSGIHYGVIEALRVLRPHEKALELAHRLDRDTSGCLLVAKKRSTLLELHQLLRDRQVTKIYWALVKGRCEKKQRVTVPLLKNQLRSGERMVMPSKAGKSAQTEFRPLQHFAEVTLLEARPLTGRTHQIRVHAQQIGHPLVGDEKYGDAAFNKSMRRLGLSRLFLHAVELQFVLPSTKQTIAVCACLDAQLLAGLQKLAER